MYNWMKWLRLLGGWHFIAATAIKPPKAACQFAADDILLYKFAIISNGFTSPFGKKEKKNCHLYNTILSLYISYHFKSLHIISRHYKKSLLRSQIYHGYEELSTDTNYPIWRRQKLPYMKKTRKKKQVCGAACFMAAEIKFSEDVRPSVTPFWLCSLHPIIMKFSEVVTNDKCDVHAKSQGQRSKVKVTEVTTQLNRFRTVTPVWFHIWWWNYTYCFMLLRRVPYCFARSSVKFQGHTALKIAEFDPDWAFPDCNSSLNLPMATKCCTKLEVALKRCPIVFEGHPSNFKVTRL